MGLEWPRAPGPECRVHAGLGVEEHLDLGLWQQLDLGVGLMAWMLHRDHETWILHGDHGTWILHRDHGTWIQHRDPRTWILLRDHGTWIVHRAPWDSFGGDHGPHAPRWTHLGGEMVPIWAHSGGTVRPMAPGLQGGPILGSKFRRKSLPRRFCSKRNPFED